MNRKQAIELALTKIPKFVAQDRDGSWWAYFGKPHIVGNNVWDLDSSKASIRLSKSDGIPINDWKDSLAVILYE